MLGRTDRRLRMVALLLVFAVFGTAAMLRLGYWQVSPRLTWWPRPSTRWRPPSGRRWPGPRSSIATA